MLEKIRTFYDQPEMVRPVPFPTPKRWRRRCFSMSSQLRLEHIAERHTGLGRWDGDGRWTSPVFDRSRDGRHKGRRRSRIYFRAFLGVVPSQPGQAIFFSESVARAHSRASVFHGAHVWSSITTTSKPTRPDIKVHLSTTPSACPLKTHILSLWVSSAPRRPGSNSQDQQSHIHLVLFGISGAVLGEHRRESRG